MEPSGNKRRRVAAMDEDSVSALRRLVRGGQQYASANSEQLQELIQSEVEDLAEITGVSSDTAILLLHCYGWKRQKLLEDWYDDEERVKGRCGLSGDKRHIPQPASTFFCEIELDDFDSNDVDCAGCGHVFSKVALQNHFSQVMQQNANNDKAGGGSLLRCPGQDGTAKCSQLFLPSHIKQLVTPALWSKYQDASARNYAIAAANVRFCPAPDCPWAIVCREGGLTGSETVQCAEGHEPFCFRCGKVEHEPATCKEVREWEIKNDGGNAAYLRENCKICPSCSTAIERSTGCNKVICTKCGKAFCWMCGQDFSKAHDYPKEAWACNKPPATFSRDSTSEQARLLYFVDRVESTKQSALLATNLAANTTHAAARAQLQEKVAQGLGYAVSSTVITDLALRRSLGAATALPMIRAPSSTGTSSSGAAEGADGGMRGNSSAQDGLARLCSSGVEQDATGMEWIPETLSVVVQGRNVLKWAYVHTFFMVSDQEQALFSEQQSHLEAGVDKLQSMLETQAIVNLLKGSPVLSDGTKAASASTSPSVVGGRHVGTSTYVASSSDSGGAGGLGAGSAPAPAGPCIMDDPTKPLVDRYRDWKLRTLALAHAVRTARKQLFEGAQSGVLMETEYAIASSSSAQAAGGSTNATGAGVGTAGSGVEASPEAGSLLSSFAETVRHGVLAVLGSAARTSSKEGGGAGASTADGTGTAASSSPSTIVAGHASAQEPVNLAPAGDHLSRAVGAGAGASKGDRAGLGEEDDDEYDNDGSQGSFDYQYEDDE